MPYSIEQIRNLVLVGHSGSGKTSLAEAMVYCTGGINRLGRTEEGNTVSDYDQEEIERQISLRTSLLNGDWNGHHINIMDTPGYSDFLTEAKAAMRVAEGAVVVVDASQGVDIGSERVWGYAAEYKVPRLVFVNKLDRDELDLDDVLAQIRDRFGRQAVPFQLPVNAGDGFDRVIDLVEMRLLTFGDAKVEASEIPAEFADEAAALREQLVEAVAETDEELMEKYFSEGELTTEEFSVGIKNAIRRLELFPVLYGAAYSAAGVAPLLDASAAFMPAPTDLPELEANAEAPLAAFVFKTVSEHHVGGLSFLRLYAGTLKAGDDVFNASRQNNERIGQIYRLNGHERLEVESATAGDIVALVKLKDTHTGNTLCAKGSNTVLPDVVYPEPLIRVAVSPKEKGQEDRMGAGLTQLHEEDPSFVFRYDGAIRQSLVLADQTPPDTGGSNPPRTGQTAVNHPRTRRACLC